MPEHFRSDPVAARQLPGIGRYTANAIATFAFGRSAPLVEANISRVLARLCNLNLRVDSTAGRELLWRLAAELVPARHADRFNSALMDLGALVCVSGKPRCHACPVKRFCRARRPELLPLKRMPLRIRRLIESHAFAIKENKILLEQSSGRWRGMWILPKLHSSPGDGSSGPYFCVSLHPSSHPASGVSPPLAQYPKPPPALDQDRRARLHSHSFAASAGHCRSPPLRAPFCNRRRISVCYLRALS